jgi:hypothetical protein
MTERSAELNSGVLPGNVHTDDWVFLALAVVSAGLLGYVVISPPTPQAGSWLFWADTAICAIFLVEFLVRWHRNRWNRRFPVKNWYEVLALPPVAHPALYHLHFLLVVLLLVRIGRVVDRTVGEQFTYRLVDKFAAPIVHAIKKPITIAVLDEVVKVLETGNYPENLARALTDNRAELRDIISEKLAEDPQLGRLRLVPFHDEIVRSVVDTSFRVVLEVLKDPRIDDFFAAVVRDNREQIRHAVQLGLNDREPASDDGQLPVRPQGSALREYDERHPNHR